VIDRPLPDSLTTFMHCLERYVILRCERFRGLVLALSRTLSETLGILAAHTLARLKTLDREVRDSNGERERESERERERDSDGIQYGEAEGNSKWAYMHRKSVSLRVTARRRRGSSVGCSRSSVEDGDGGPEAQHLRAYARECVCAVRGGR
jgi:hypothetical protein